MRDDLHIAQVALKSIRLALNASPIGEDQHRAVEIYLLVTAMNVNQVLAAEVAGCTKQNVSKLLKSVEDRRDRDAFDRALEALERAIMGE